MYFSTKLDPIFHHFYICQHTEQTTASTELNIGEKLLERIWNLQGCISWMIPSPCEIPSFFKNRYYQCLTLVCTSLCPLTMFSPFLKRRFCKCPVKQGFWLWDVGQMKDIILTMSSTAPFTRRLEPNDWWQVISRAHILNS